MNAKLKKGLTYLGAGLFLIALFINVKTTINDPYFFQRALATVEEGTEEVITNPSNAQFYKHDWHPSNSTVIPHYCKLTVSQPTSTSSTAVNGNLSLAPGVSVGVGGGYNANRTYTINIFHYECEYSSWKYSYHDNCAYSEEHTLFAYF